MDNWTAQERKVARTIAKAVYGSTYRNLAVIKRLACLMAARRLIQVETRLGMFLEDE